MKVNNAYEFHTIDGKPIASPETPDKCMTMQSALLGALLAQLEEDRGIAGDKVLSRWKLAHRIYAAKEEIELTPEEATLLRERIVKVWGIQVAAPAYELLAG